MTKQEEIRDKARLNWLSSDSMSGEGLISDDAGRWAISSGGMQNVPDPDKAIDISTMFFVEAEDWRDSVREAIDAAMQKEQDEEDD